MKFKLIVTLGPSIIDKDKLNEIDACGDCLYRINGAHIDIKQIEKLIINVREILPRAKIVIDLPGNKIRTNNLAEPIRLIKGKCFDLHDYEINYPICFKYIRRGDKILANDSVFKLEVIEVKKNYIKLLSHSDGILLSNKGLHIKYIYKYLPFLLEKDRQLIKLARAYNIDYLSASFVRDARDIREIKDLLAGSNIQIIAKIETAIALRNLKSIFDEVKHILVDRGDLFNEIDILEFAEIQDSIIQFALKSNINIYLATQFLKNMENNPVPLIPELIDLCKTIKLGINGIQLSEETSIGRYPIECIKLIFSIVKRNSLEK